MPSARMVPVWVGTSGGGGRPVRGPVVIERSLCVTGSVAGAWLVPGWDMWREVPPGYV